MTKELISEFRHEKGPTLSQYMALLFVLCCMEEYQADALNMAGVHHYVQSTITTQDCVSQDLNLGPACVQKECVPPSQFQEAVTQTCFHFLRQLLT